MHPQKRMTNTMYDKKKMLHNIINGKRQVLLHALIWVFKKWDNYSIYNYVYFLRTNMFITFTKYFWKVIKIANTGSLRNGGLGGRGSGVGWILLFQEFRRCFPRQQHHLYQCIYSSHRQHACERLN